MKEEKLVQSIATKIKQSKLEAPALVFLQMHLPALSLFHTSALLFEPLLTPFFGLEKLNDYKNLLADRENIKHLIELIETPNINS